MLTLSGDKRMSESQSDVVTFDDYKRKARITLILLILLSPGTLMVFADSKFAPVPLVIMWMVGVIYVYWLIRHTSLHNNESPL